MKVHGGENDCTKFKNSKICQIMRFEMSVSCKIMHFEIAVFCKIMHFESKKVVPTLA